MFIIISFFMNLRCLNQTFNLLKIFIYTFLSRHVFSINKMITKTEIRKLNPNTEVGQATVP